MISIKTAIILPAYNEELTIEKTIRAFHEEVPTADIYVINNASVDATEELATRTLKELPCGGRVINENRKGKGNAVRRAFLEIDADIYVMSDADMTYPANRIHDLIKPIQDGTADVVVGDRHSAGHYASENKRALHNFGNHLVKNMVNKLFNANLADIMSGYRAFNKKFVKTYPILVEEFEIETDMTLHTLDKRFRILEMPVEYQDRPEGSESKLNTIKDGTKVIFTIFRILRYYRPLMFFGIISVLLATLGIVFGYHVVEEWVRDGTVNHLPLAVLATGLELLAALSLAVGLILDSIIHLDKNAFELELLKRKK
jgi:glycosyltransferase involved in cell wall biosynthesis